MRSVFFIILKIFFFTSHNFCQSNESAISQANDSIYYVHIQTDSLFNSIQNINLIVMNQICLSVYELNFAYHSSELTKTSRIGKKREALAAINGSFFDMETGDNVTYFERDDSVISRTRPSNLKWAVPDSLANGAIILNKNHTLEIESARSEQFYEESTQEIFVMISGPLLIKDSLAQKLPDMKFSNMRHPRTCVAMTEESIILLAIDGRSEHAEGMSLVEVQEFLLGLGCLNAINLDGGGSTSMWTRNKGILNLPSDKTGERPVANALIIQKK